MLHSHEYAQPGDKNTAYELWTVRPRDSGRDMQAQAERIDFGEAPELHWRGDGQTLPVRERPTGGISGFACWKWTRRRAQARAVIDERAKTFINTSDSYLYYTKDATEIIYASEMDGWRHLYICMTPRSGGVSKTRSRAGNGWCGNCQPGGRRKPANLVRRQWPQSPARTRILIHHYRINFDGSGLTALTEGNGDHSLQYSPDRRYVIIDTYSRADLPPVHELRRTSDGKLWCALWKHSDISALTAQGLAAAGSLPRQRGATGKPTSGAWFSGPTQSETLPERYPVIENIYAGPQDSFTRKTFAVRDAMQSLAELGFIVVQCDGMGTRNRSKAFHDVCWHNLKDAGLPDRIAWMKGAGAKAFLLRHGPCRHLRHVGGRPVFHRELCCSTPNFTKSPCLPAAAMTTA